MGKYRTSFDYLNSIRLDARGILSFGMCEAAELAFHLNFLILQKVIKQWGQINQIFIVLPIFIPNSYSLRICN